MKSLRRGEKRSRTQKKRMQRPEALESQIGANSGSRHSSLKSPSWLLLIYKVPPEPAKKRIALWRRLKSMGAVYLQNGVCLLPKTDDHVRRIKILENKIAEMEGEAVILETAAVDRSQDEKVIARFRADRDEEYKEFLVKCTDFEAEIAKETAANHLTYAELEENDVDRKKLQSWLEKIRKLDFYRAPVGAEAEQRLQACEAVLEAYRDLLPAPKCGERDSG